MLPELPERDASGEIARIYQAFRHYCAVPYVSSLQRHLATRAGWLEWAWAAVGPVFVDGSGPEAAWRVAAALEIEPLPVLDVAGRRALGLDPAAEAAVGAVCATFIRASPTNLMFSGILRRLLRGEQPGGGPHGGSENKRGGDTWRPPEPPAPPPAMVEVGALPAAERAVLMRFAATVDGLAFVPGPYRMLANLPGLLAHLAEVLLPRFDDAATRAACDDLLARIDAAVPGVMAGLPPLPAAPPNPPRPAEAEFPAVLAALDSYRVTSPQMVVFSTLIRDSLI